MNYQIVTDKIAYYSNWYESLEQRERLGWQGQWIKERILFFQEAINHQIKNVA
jgi:hypothetical protein